MVNDYMIKYNKWLTAPFIDSKTKQELASAHEPADIADRFYKDLEFGTGGLRGIMGAGTNRVNKYTIRKATYGLANYLLDKYGEAGKERGVVISYDSRLNSQTFALEAALVFCAVGIKTFLFAQLQPTPVLSFSVRHLKCMGGIMITASHNPKQYNGYKVYNEHGYQAVPDEADEIIAFVNQVKDFALIPVIEEQGARELGLLVSVDESVLEAYQQAVNAQSLIADPAVKADLRIVFTPLHGTGYVPVTAALDRAGFEHVFVVEEQKLPDGNFPTVKSPNPEEKDALALAVAKAKEVGADLVIGTDPDSDRVGAAVKHQGSYEFLTGNQIGALLTYFVLSQKQQDLTPKSTMIKTIVTNELGAEIALSYGLQVLDTLTGFKYIGEKITEFEQTGSHEFIIGYEESYGYLVGTHARDKDAVVAALLICEMTAFYREQGRTLIDVLAELYDKYGCYLDHLDAIELEGIEGRKRIESIMAALRGEGSKLIPDVAEMLEYSLGIGDLPKSDVLKFVLNDGSWLAARPSGTEPKLKIYYSIKQPCEELAQAKLDQLQAVIKNKFVDAEGHTL